MLILLRRCIFKGQIIFFLNIKIEAPKMCSNILTKKKNTKYDDSNLYYYTYIHYEGNTLVKMSLNALIMVILNSLTIIDEVVCDFVSLFLFIRKAFIK